ncbi:efflux RND transporter permease subunit [Marinimicrobium sp.]|jgi:cobalt-zinc-cadmium resistance protein CzcA|uniref:efflux RND transporter permease subunit n=1 Tax=Marinimicrobium TaxID=359337 RepID=UPI000C3B20E5|nr:CusA/CzcA family heavy metal efflux RND transporter [Marinimicrobium sp.]MAN50304.1 CusA/CzcA family heavy metal efflux RND transporter [Marinimicrobium sp.]
MIESILRFSVERRYLTLSFIFVLIGLGVWSYQRLPIDAVPDITNVQVQINTQAPGYSPLEAEQRITYPVETALAGLPNLSYTRSLSRYGLSQVTVVFEDGTDIYFARNLIDERLGAIKNDLPPGLEPEMGPIATGLGEIFTYTVEALPGAVKADGTPYDATALREVQDWIIEPQLALVPGIVEINTIGGFAKQYHVTPDPRKLLVFDVTLDDVSQALRNNNNNRGAGYIEHNGEQLLVRSPGQLQTITDIEQVVVKLVDGSPVRVADIAEVAIGKELRSGAATRNGVETVVGTAMMLMGANSRAVARDLAIKLEEIESSLPEGVRVDTVYDRTTLVDKAIATVKKNLLEGALLVIAVLFVLLGNIRAALITAAVIPLSMLATVFGMVKTGVSANLMSLGALDFGLIVDGAVIIVENATRRLAEAQASDNSKLERKERLRLVFEATNEVIRPSLFGVLIITVVYIPLFTLTGVEGKMFQPMAATVVMALLAALVLSLTVVPASVAVFMTGRVSEKENRAIVAAKSLYRPLLSWVLRLRWGIISGATILVFASSWLATTLGSEFVPQLDEGDITVQALRVTGTGLEQSVAMQEMLERRIRSFPQVDKVLAKVGTAEVATDPMPPNVVDNFVILKPRSEWPNPKLPKDELLQELEEALEEVPGNNYEITQPIEMRFNELISGVRADLGIKVFGDDLEQLLASAEAILAVLNDIEGSADARVEQVDGLPMLSVHPDRMAISRYGLTVDDVQDFVATAIGGESVGLIYEGDRRFELVVRLPENVRRDVKHLHELPVPLPEGGYAPLSELATLVIAPAPSQISRENGKRRVVVMANVRGRDLGSFVAETKQRVTAEVKLKAGYWLDYGGTFEQLASASQRLSLVVPVTFAIIIVILVVALGSLKDALIIFTGVPLALTGGVLALWFRDMPLSISAGVGFIALSGVAVLNGLVMLAFIRDRWHVSGDLASSIIEGALLRLRPVLMTALVASLGFVPMALNTGTGAEVQRPLATVVIGGIISSTLLTLLVLPALYSLVHGGSRANRKA